MKKIAVLLPAFVALSLVAQATHAQQLVEAPLEKSKAHGHAEAGYSAQSQTGPVATFEASALANHVSGGLEAQVNTAPTAGAGSSSAAVPKLNAQVATDINRGRYSSIFTAAGGGYVAAATFDRDLAMQRHWYAFAGIGIAGQFKMDSDYGRLIYDYSALTGIGLGQAGKWSRPNDLHFTPNVQLPFLPHFDNALEYCNRIGGSQKFRYCLELTAGFGIGIPLLEAYAKGKATVDYVVSDSPGAKTVIYAGAEAGASARLDAAAGHAAANAGLVGGVAVE